MFRSDKRKVAWTVPTRTDLLTRLAMAGREQSNAAVMFHTAVASLMGLNATESKTLDLLQREGPLSPGDLARRTGLAPASVTGMLHRLQEKGFVRRRPDPGDGRRLIVTIDHDVVSRYQGLFEGLMRELSAVYEDYTDDELALVAGWVERVTEAQQRATTALPPAS